MATRMLRISGPGLMWVLLLALLLGGCAGAVPAATPSPTPTPAELVTRAGRTTQAAQSISFTIELAGRPVYSDGTRLFAIRSIDGAIRRPDGALATLKVRAAVGVAEIRTVSLAGQQYFTNPVTRQWQCLPAGAAFDPGVLFDSQRGIGVLLEQGIDQPSLVGIEQIDGRATQHLRGSLAPERLRDISAGLIGAGPVAIDVWADIETGRIARIVLVDTATDPAEPTTWTLTLGGYDQPVDVRAPANCS